MSTVHLTFKPFVELHIGDKIKTIAYPTNTSSIDRWCDRIILGSSIPVCVAPLNVIANFYNKATNTIHVIVMNQDYTPITPEQLRQSLNNARSRDKNPSQLLRITRLCREADRDCTYDDTYFIPVFSSASIMNEQPVNLSEIN